MNEEIAVRMDLTFSGSLRLWFGSHSPRALPCAHGTSSELSPATSHDTISQAKLASVTG
jgi:hypothetical protein